MTPYSPNSNQENCSPISSNCVIWQGPDLPCLHLCKGDSVSDVVYKVAVEVCNLKDSIGISDVDLTCLLQICSTTPKPAQTLANILDLLITKVCCLNDFVKTLPTTQNTYTEPTLALTPCLIPTGSTTTSLLHSQYTLRIASVLCTLYTQVNTNTADIVTIKGQIRTLQNPTIVVPTHTSCLSGGVKTFNEIALQDFEDLFCTYSKGPLGTVASLNSGMAAQCKDLNNVKLLATGKYITSLTGQYGWVSSPTSIGDSIKNLWAMVCDLRAAVKLIQDSCCKVSCNSISVDFSYQWIDKNTLRLFFYNKTIVPGSFYDCDQVHGTVFNVTDGLGNVTPLILMFRQNGATTGILDDTTITPFQSYTWTNIGSTTSLDVTTGLTITGDVCFTDGTTSCVKCVSKYIGAYINKDCCTITAKTPTTIVYKVCPTTTTTTIPV